MLSATSMILDFRMLNIIFDMNTTMELKKKVTVCEVCSKCDAKYTCPKCEIRTCSLPCVRIHKMELLCNGVDSATDYIPPHKLKDKDLYNDFNFLVKILNSKKSYERDLRRHRTKDSALPRHLYKLMAAVKKHNITLVFMPQQFTKHRINTTYFDWKTKQIFWRLEWLFPDAQEPVKFINERMEDTEILGAMLEKFIKSSTEDARLQPYCSVSIDDIALLLRLDNSEEEFCPVFRNQSIRTILNGKTIVEFPTIFVILKK